MNADARIAPFIEARPRLDAWRRRAARDLQGLLETHGVQFQFVASRTKSTESLRTKLARPDKTYQKVWDVTDIVGLRIATYLEDTIDDVARLIEQTWRVDYQHSTDKLRFTDHGRFGYRSLHYVCAAPVDAGLDDDLRIGG